EFAVKLFEQKTEEDVRKLFSSEGVEITDENLKNLKTLCSEIVDKLKDIDKDELENVAGGGDFFDIAHLTSRASISNAVISGLVGLGFSVYNDKNLKDEKSFGKRIADHAVKTLIGAAAGYAGGTAWQAVNVKWLD
ncbi:MAG: hypothetical protein LBJ32_01370, partial [Oscillospiraceae bacterium]|nr:hypothetical protein [Oscillospiraceae bacterium]